MQILCQKLTTDLLESGERDNFERLFLAVLESAIFCLVLECIFCLYRHIWHSHVKIFMKKACQVAQSSFRMLKLGNQVQSTLLISNSLISNNRLSRNENLVPVLIQRSINRQQNIVEKRRNCSLGAISPLFHNIFNIYL